VIDSIFVAAVFIEYPQFLLMFGSNPGFKYLLVPSTYLGNWDCTDFKRQQTWKV